MDEPADITLTDDGTGHALAHRVDCAEARKQAARGEPVLTMYGGKGLPAWVKRHACLTAK